MEHTKEPWRANRHASMSIESAEGRGVCSTGGYADNFSNGAYHDENEANARRIVSCVNAMQGIDDPAAMRAAFDAMQKALDCAREEIVRSACELPDRTSPEGEPDVLLVTVQELSELIEAHFDEALTAARIARGVA